MTLYRLLRDRVLATDVAGKDVVLCAVPGVRSGLDVGDVASGRETGARPFG